MINHVEEVTRRKNVAIAYIYCDYKDPKTALELISSLTRQLAGHIGILPLGVKQFHDDNARTSRNPTDDEYLLLVKSISHSFEEIYVFIDALVTFSSC